jgi:ABC-2 type transport system permease protein
MAGGARRRQVHSGAVAEGGYGVLPDAATFDRRDLPLSVRMYAALVAAGFRRYATYRQATVAGAFTNTVFGFLRCYVLLSAATALGGAVAGYSASKIATFVWVGQGLLGTVQLWGGAEYAERIRTGQVVTDLLRPVDVVWQQLATDLGRAGHAALTRFVVPLIVGAFAFDLYAPRRVATYPLFALSVLCGVVVSFGCRFLVNAAAYWLLDARGPQLGWLVLSTVFSGLMFPLWFLPRPAAVALFVATPLPSLMQVPLDVLTERAGVAGQVGLVALQAGWVVVMLALCRLVQRRGERRLVVQGG